jgi:hypothetical protein
MMLLCACPDLTQSPEGYGPMLEVTFPDHRADGTLPFEPGGRLLTHLKATSLGKLCGPIRATVELVDPQTLPDAGGRGQAVLSPQDDGGCGDDHEGDALLFFPPGGPVGVRASIAGAIKFESAALDSPTLSVNFGGESRDGLSIRVPVCIDTNVVKGTTTVQLSGATVSGAASGQLPVLEKGCDGGTDHHSSFTAVASRGQIEVVASLDGTLRVAERKSQALASSFTPVTVVVRSDPTFLPDAGGLLSITATVAIPDVDAGIKNIPVVFEMVPMGQLLPAATTTDPLGEAHTTVLVPPDVTQVRVDAIAGGVRNGITVSRQH